MSELCNLVKIKFNSPLIKMRLLAKRKSLILQGQKTYLNSKGPYISNELYWRKIVEKFELAKLDTKDETLNPHLNSFLDWLGNTQRSILEFGCGIGRAVDVLKTRGFTNYLGTDICDRAVELARKRCAGTNFEKNNVLTYKTSNKYDGIIATDVLLYLSPEDQIKALLNIKRHLKDNGLLLLRWAPGDNKISYKQDEATKEDIGWVFLASIEYIKQLLDVTGFKLQRPIQPETVPLYKGTPDEKMQDYLPVFAIKA